MAREQRPRLGRGLSSLIRNSVTDAAQYEAVSPAIAVQTPPAVSVAAEAVIPAEAQAFQATAEGVLNIPVGQIHPNPYQPRREFEPAALAELAESIRLHGVLEPLVVCPRPESNGSGGFYIIAGERRLRASQLAGRPDVPCVLRHANRQEMLELALVENIHRSDLNAIERAVAYRDLMDQFALSQQQAAERVGEPRTTVANYLRLLDLCNDVQSLIRSGQVSFGHGKVLASLAGQADRQLLLAKRCVHENLSVRQLEDLVKQLQEGVAEPELNNGGQTPKAKSAHVADLERQLTQAIGTKVIIRPGRGKHVGRIVIDYYSLEDFDRIARSLGAPLEG